MAETQKEKIMRVLNVSAAEADEIMAYDKAVDQGKPTKYDLTKEQEKEVRKYRQADRKPFVPNLTKRERKPNELKEAIVAEVAEFLREDAQGQMYEDVEITNKNRQISFCANGKKFELTLVEKRPPKVK